MRLAWYDFALVAPMERNKGITEKRNGNFPAEVRGISTSRRDGNGEGARRVRSIDSFLYCSPCNAIDVPREP